MPRKKQFEPAEVLEKAMNLFWEKGFHATSMEDLVSALGINRASLYHSFGSKKKLYELALESYHNKQSKYQSSFLYQQLIIRQGLYLLMESWAEECLKKTNPAGCFLVNSIHEMSTLDSGIRSKQLEYQNELEQNYFNYLKYGVEQNQLSPYKDLKVLSAALFQLQAAVFSRSRINSDKDQILKWIQTSLLVLD